MFVNESSEVFSKLQRSSDSFFVSNVPVGWRLEVELGFSFDWVLKKLNLVLNGNLSCVACLICWLLKCWGGIIILEGIKRRVYTKFLSNLHSFLKWYIRPKLCNFIIILKRCIFNFNSSIIYVFLFFSICNISKNSTIFWEAQILLHPFLWVMPNHFERLGWGPGLSHHWPIKNILMCQVELVGWMHTSNITSFRAIHHNPPPDPPDKTNRQLTIDSIWFDLYFDRWLVTFSTTWLHWVEFGLSPNLNWLNPWTPLLILLYKFYKLICHNFFLKKCIYLYYIIEVVMYVAPITCYINV